MAGESKRVIVGDVYDMPVAPDGYRALSMVADDGVLLVELKVHARAQEADMVTSFRNWLARVREKERAERRGHLTLVTPVDGDERVS